MALAIERGGTADLRINDDGEPVAAIEAGQLTSLRFRPGGRPQISGEVPLPLYWRQYANHQDPERSAAQNPRIEQTIEREGWSVVVVCSGRNGSGSVTSRSSLELFRREKPVRYELLVRTLLRVSDGAHWHVTPNPNHGELEFCTLYPVGTFSADRTVPKRYQSCVLTQGEEVWKIPHHHLESSDKHLIPLHTGGRFLWLLEDENPCLELLSPRPAQAGLCAYMWDGHFGYSVCGDGVPVDLAGGSHVEAEYRLSALSREEGAALLAAARSRPAPGIDQIPLYVPGLNRFDRSGERALEDPEQSWPWEFEIARPGDPCEGALDRTTGADDRRSLRITGAAARWVATTIGPAYGQGEFADGARYRLEALVRTRALSGEATIALRLHRSGKPGLFDPSSYEMFRSSHHVAGDHGWVRVEVVTPPISPAPDRIHLLLEQNGSGTTWFDNVLLEELG